MNSISLSTLTAIHKLGDTIRNAKIIGCKDYHAKHLYRFKDAYEAYIKAPQDMALLSVTLDAFNDLAPLIASERIEIIHGEEAK